MTLTTRATIRQDALRRVGGHVAALTSVGDTSSLISTNMSGRGGGDDTAFVGWGTYDGTDAAADAFRIITAWDDSAGDATIVPVLSGTRAGTETTEYYPRNDPHPYDWDKALDRALEESNRVVESVVPTHDGARRFTFLNLPWVESRSEILNVRQRLSPNIVTNSDFEQWGIGSGAGLQGWTLVGTSSTVTRVDGPYSYAARITRSSNDVTLTQTIPIPITQLYSETISLFGRIKCSTADVASISVSDGTDTTESSAHDGGGDWDEFTVTHTVNADAAGPLTVILNLIDSDVSADFEHVVAVVGSSVPTWLSTYGDQHARTRTLLHSVQMYGPNPVIETDRVLSQGSQIVIASRQPWFPLTADSGAGGVTDMPQEMAVAGLLVKLAEQQVGKPNAARWNAIGSYWTPRFNAWKRRMSAPSPTPTPTRVTVRSA